MPVDINLTYILGAILLSIPGYLTWWSARKEAKAAAAKVETVRRELQVRSGDISEKVEKIHVAVNSERTAMLEKIEEMHATILALSQAAVAREIKA